jgi:histidinol phosphatase-like enzyme
LEGWPHPSAIRFRSGARHLLDRDGTLNQGERFHSLPQSTDRISAVALALRRLRSAGYRLIVLTNQPVIARGEATQEELDAIHSKLEWELGKVAPI